MSNLESTAGMARAKYPSIIIKHNTHRVHDECPFCRQDHILDVGPELFLEGTDKAVCHQCALKHAPGMVALELLCKAEWKAEQERQRKLVKNALLERYSQIEPRRFRHFCGLANMH